MSAPPLISLRVTRFDPARRNAAGHFQGDDWTSVSDIGATFAAGTLDEVGYLTVEDAYVDTIVALLDGGGVGPLTVTHLEGPFGDDPLPLALEPGAPAGIDWIRDGLVVEGARLRQIVRLGLREVVWCRLEAPGGFVHFGYDYYTYVGVPRVAPATVARARLRRIFVERFRSPYLDIED